MKPIIRSQDIPYLVVYLSHPEKEQGDRILGVDLKLVMFIISVMLHELHN